MSFTQYPPVHTRLQRSELAVPGSNPDLFEKAKQYEKIDQQSGRSFTWTEGESLEELAARKDEVLAHHKKTMAAQMKESNQTLFQVLEDVLDMEDDEEPCLICHV